jgi:rsbT co-antagonist protein RsbR
MSPKGKSRAPEIIAKHESDLLADWVYQQLAATTFRSDLIKESELRQQSRQFLNLVRAASQQDGLADINAPAWAEVREFLSDLSRARASGLLTFRDHNLHLLVEAVAAHPAWPRVGTRT